ncbi:MAG: hypothetical protein ACI31R_06260 [Bacilli bacterium]
MYSATRLLDTLSPIQKRVYGLYNLVITDEMLTNEYKDILEEQILSCKNFYETNFVRTKIFAIEEYRRQRNEEVLSISGASSVDELLRNENDNIDYEFYDFIKEINEEEDSYKEKIKSSR